MGFLPPLIRVRRTAAWQVALFSLALSMSIEVSQYVSGIRWADVDDLILNTLGGMLGYGLGIAFMRKPVRASTSLDHSAIQELTPDPTSP